MDAWLIITAIVMSFVIFAVVGMMVILYGHKDDKNTQYFPKVVIVRLRRRITTTHFSLPCSFRILSRRPRGRRERTIG